MSTTEGENDFSKRLSEDHPNGTIRHETAAHSSGPTGTLCANCLDIGLFAILKGYHKGIPLQEGHEVWITRRSDPTAIWIWNLQPGCEFCDFISAARIHLLPKDASKRPRYLQLDCGKSYYRNYEEFGPSTELSWHVNIVFDSLHGRPEDEKFSYSRPADVVSFSVPMDAEMLDFQPAPLQVNEISAWLDLNDIKRRLQKCLRYHMSCELPYEMSSSRPSRLRVIDCSSRCIVTPPDHSPYVALSYRWGESHSEPQKRLSNMALEKLPATIEDAIVVTRSLGFQYLWIDKYCILQADDFDFKHQIRQMHLIYRSAEITIIAGGGMDASSGLIGISTPRANVQTKGRYGNLNLITFSLWPWSSVEFTQGWINRGWTLQEGYFSQRRLIFTDEQVLFECDSGVISDDLQHSQIQYLYPLQRGKPEVIQKDIHDLIEDYTKRVLTHDNDILNAFDGILGDLEQREPPIRSHWGICSVLDTSKYLGGLLIGLCWVHEVQNERIYRRVGFPSWSWAGWSYDPHAYYSLHRGVDTKLFVPHGLEIHVEKEDGDTESWEEFAEADPASTQRHHYSQWILISAPSLEVRLRKGFNSVTYLGRKIHGHAGWVVRGENDGYWPYIARLDTPFENLESSPDTHVYGETKTCYAIYLFLADKMGDTNENSIPHNTFSMLLVSKVGDEWERVGLWTPSFESGEDAEIFGLWLHCSPTYKTRDFWIG
jgi:hypothetical protein